MLHILLAVLCIVAWHNWGHGENIAGHDSAKICCQAKYRVEIHKKYAKGSILEWKLSISSSLWIWQFALQLSPKLAIQSKRYIRVVKTEPSWGWTLSSRWKWGCSDWREHDRERVSGYTNSLKKALAHHERGRERGRKRTSGYTPLEYVTVILHFTAVGLLTTC